MESTGARDEDDNILSRLLLVAAEAGDAMECRELLSRGANVNYRKFLGQTALLSMRKICDSHVRNAAGGGRRCNCS